MTPKQEMICRQLVLRAVVWDAEDLDKNERKKLEEEIQAFRIRRIQVKRRQNAAQQPHSVYNGIQKALREAGISEKTALLVTGDAALAQYVYDCGNKKDSDGNSRRRQNAGMGVVFYEKSGSRAAAAADMVVLGFEEIGVQFLDRVQKRRNRLPWIILYTSGRMYARLRCRIWTHCMHCMRGRGLRIIQSLCLSGKKKNRIQKAILTTSIIITAMACGSSATERQER